MRRSICVLQYNPKNNSYEVIEDPTSLYKLNLDFFDGFRFGIERMENGAFTECRIGENDYQILLLSANKEAGSKLVITPVLDSDYHEISSVLKELAQKQQSLFSYAQSKHLSHESITSVLEGACERIAKLLSCERISIWLFNEDWTEMVAQNIFDSAKVTHSVGSRLKKSECPVFFEAVRQKRTIAVTNVASDNNVKELFDSYFMEHGQSESFLSASIISSRGLAGLFCCEVFEKRNWTQLDRLVISTLADMGTFLFDRLYRIEVEKDIQMLAYTDWLTGLDNEYSFKKKAEENLLKLSGRERGIFIYTRLDQFSEIQRALGRQVGKEILKITADRLRHIFPKPVVIGRVDFDHFILFYPYKGNRISREINMAAINKELGRPMDLVGQEVYMTYSFGVSIYPDHVGTVNDGIQAAHIAFEAGREKSPRKASAAYKPEMYRGIKKMMQSEMNLRKALNLNEFRLFYQPQVNCDTGEVKGFEALIRWQHPERGLILPEKFIDFAESTGLILSIGEWVIKEAFIQLGKWSKAGRSDLTVSINLSPQHFLHPGLPAYLLKWAKKLNVHPRMLILEITETVAIEDHKIVENRILQLTKHGFSISIDDFGTGYSAFSYLQNFSIQQIKIDRQFICRLEKDSKSVAITKTIIGLAGLLGLNVIAEGVETLEQWQILKGMKCNEIQGYYFSKPLPVEEIEALLFADENKGSLCLPYHT